MTEREKYLFDALRAVRKAAIESSDKTPGNADIEKIYEIATEAVCGVSHLQATPETAAR